MLGENTKYLTLVTTTMNVLNALSKSQPQARQCSLSTEEKNFETCFLCVFIPCNNSSKNGRFEASREWTVAEPQENRNSRKKPTINRPQNR